MSGAQVKINVGIKLRVWFGIDAGIKLSSVCRDPQAHVRGGRSITAGRTSSGRAASSDTTVDSSREASRHTACNRQPTTSRDTCRKHSTEGR